MKDRSKSIRNIVYQLLGQILTIAFGLLLPRLYIVGYGSEVNGLLSSLQQVIVYLSLFEAGIGMVSLQALYEPIKRTDWNRVNAVLSSSNYYYRRTGKYYFLVLTGLTFVYPLVVPTSLPYFMVAGVVFLSGAGNVILFGVQAKYKVLLEADGRNYIISNLTTLSTILVSITKIVLIGLGFGVIPALLSGFVVSVMQAGVYSAYVRKHYPAVRISRNADTSILKQRNSVLVHQISGLVFQNTDVLILTFFCGLKVVSVYALFKLITTHIESIIGIAAKSFGFILGQTFHTDIELFKKRIDCFESLYCIVSCSLLTVVLYLYLPFMRLYTKNVTDINYVDPVLAVLFVAVSLLTMLRIPMLSTINYAGHFQLTLPQTILESVINITVSLVGVVKFGIYGVLIGTVAALLYRNNDVIFYTNHKILNRSVKKTYFIHLMSLLLFALLTGLFYWCSPVIATWGTFILAGLVAGITSFAVFTVAHLLLVPGLKEELGKILAIC